MIFIDTLLVSGIRFVLDKLATAADSELNDSSRLHDTLLEAQMLLELGEISDEEFAKVEAEVSERLREVRRREGEQTQGEDVRIAGVEVSVDEALEES